MSKIQEMSSFVAVVDAGSFVGAADFTGASKAAVSRHVGELEKRLGVRLLHRTTRRLSLTDEGRMFFERAKELLESIEEAEAELTRRSGEARGILRVNAPLTFGALHLAPLWGAFADANPLVSLDITLNDRVVDLVDEGYDLAIRITTIPDSRLVTRQLASTRMVLCASPTYLRRRGTPTHPRDLAKHAVISYSYWATRDEWQFTGPQGRADVRITPRIHTNNGDTCRRVALDHHGIILQPDFIVGEDVRRGDLVELMPEFRSIEIGIYAVYPSRQFLPLKTRRLIDFLADAMRTPSWSRRVTAPKARPRRPG
jgi:DNA-binding transcriptional LysR family regulator